MSRTPLHLMEHPEDLLVVRLAADESPSWDWVRGPIASLTRSSAETSVICLADGVPEGPRREGPFRVVEVAGPLDFSMIGVMADLLEPVVKERISVLAISTYDTDWLLVPSSDVRTAVEAWRRAGFIVTPALLTGKSS